MTYQRNGQCRLIEALIKKSKKMEKVKFELETIVSPEDLLKDELATIKGGNVEPITCSGGRVKCKDGDAETEASLSVW